MKKIFAIAATAVALSAPNTPRGKGMLPVGVTHCPTPGGLDFNKLPRIASCAAVSHNG